MFRVGRRFIAAVVLGVAVSGCATTGTGAQYRPIIDKRGVDFNKFEIDLSQCQEYALSQPSAASSAAAGAVAGAAFMALLAAVAGSKYDSGAAARVGGVTGAVSGAADAESDKREIIRKCLRGRGYSVLK
jgi:hypothetical protein